MLKSGRGVKASNKAVLYYWAFLAPFSVDWLLAKLLLNQRRKQQIQIFYGFHFFSLHTIITKTHTDLQYKHNTFKLSNIWVGRFFFSFLFLADSCRKGKKIHCKRFFEMFATLSVQHHNARTKAAPLRCAEKDKTVYCNWK